MEIILILRQGLWLIIVLSGPVLVVTVIFGLIISMLQATMQLQDQALPFAIKLLLVGVTLSLTGRWIGIEVIEFTNLVFTAMGDTKN